MTGWLKIVPALARALDANDVAQLPPLVAALCRDLVVEAAGAEMLLAPLLPKVQAQIAEASAATCETRLALADLRNAIACVVLVRDPIGDQVVRKWLRELVDAPLPQAQRARVGFAALALADTHVAHQIAATSSTDASDHSLSALRELVATLTAPRHPLLFGYGITLRPALRLLEPVEQVEPATLLWIGRIVTEILQILPSSTARDGRWRVPQPPEDDERERADAEVQLHAFPHGERLAGAYTITELLQGMGQQQLWLARHDTSGRHALVAFDGKMSRQKLEELHAELRVPLPTGFELVHAGHVDRPPRRADNATYIDSTWLVAEACPEGTWLPRLIPRLHDPAVAPRMAIQLSLSAGRLIERAAAAGTLLVRARPEYMWATHERDRWTVTGVSDRADRLFALRRYTLPTMPLFDRAYHAPEYYEAPSDRSLVFTLGVMIAEWATGRYPAGYIAQDMPEPLCGLVARALRETPAERPTLDAFLASLADLHDH